MLDQLDDERRKVRLCAVEAELTVTISSFYEAEQAPSFQLPSIPFAAPPLIAAHPASQ